VPWPVRKQFHIDHEQRGRSKPGCREVGLTTITQLVTEADSREVGLTTITQLVTEADCREVGLTTITQLVTEADCQSSFHCVFLSTGDTSNHIGCREHSH